MRRHASTVFEILLFFFTDSASGELPLPEDGRYSNLNSIAQAWKVMNEQARNNVHFRLKDALIQAIRGFFQDTWKRLAPSLIDRINDTFPTIAEINLG